MKKIIAGFILAGTMLLAGGDLVAPVAVYEAPQEREKLYVGIGLGSNETYARNSHTNFTGYSEGEYTNLGLTAIAGYDAVRFDNSSILAEVRIGQSFWMEDSENFTTGYASLLLKPVYNFTEQFAMYGLVGFSYVDWVDNEGGWLSHSSKALAIGLGAQLEVSYNVYIFADYLLNATDTYSEFFDDNVNLDQATIGLLYRF